MKLAYVTATDRVSPSEKRYMASVFDAAREAAGVDAEMVIVPAIQDTQQRKTPPIAELRAGHAGLIDRLAHEGPDTVVPLGTAALNCLVNPKVALTLKRSHGVMHELASGVTYVPTVDAWRVVKSPDLHRDFASVVYKALTQRAPLPAMEIETHVCRDKWSLRSALALLDGASVVGVDVETTGLRGWDDAVTALGIGAVYSDTEGIAVVVPWELLGPEVADDLWDAVWRSSRRSAGHNFKFDMQFLEPLIGWPPDEALRGDTLLLAHLLDERPNHPKSRARGSGLKDLVAQRYDHEYGFDFERPYEQLSDSEITDLHAYLAEDCVYTARLWLDLEREAREESDRLMEAHDRLLMPVSLAVARAETRGAPVDVAWVEETVELLDRRVARRQAELERAVERLAPTMVVSNILAPLQVADVMYDEWGMTPDVRRHGKLVQGDRSTDQDHVKAAVAKYRRAGSSLWAQAGWLQSLIRLRKDVRLASVYRKQILDREDGGRMHPTFLLHGAATGRISARDPAVQTIAAVDDVQGAGAARRYKLRDGTWAVRPMRRAFAPEPGRVWVEVDYSQLELRVAAGISGDEAFTEVFRRGRDVHREVAASIFSKEPDAVSKPERYLAKAVAFGMIYGRSAKALAGGAEMDLAEREMGLTRWTEEQAERFMTSFLRSFPTLTAWMAEQHRKAEEEGHVESPRGRRRRFPLVVNGSALAEIRRQSVNTPIQAEASDICLEAFTKIDHIFSVQAELDGRVDGPRLLFPVHDSICIDVLEEDVEWVERVCRDNMETDWKGVPLTVDFEYGTSWADVQPHG